MNIVEMVTPVNAGEEKRKWLEKAARGEWTNPSFQYNTELLAGVASYERQLKELGGAMMTAFGTVSNENAEESSLSARGRPLQRRSAPRFIWQKQCWMTSTRTPPPLLHWETIFGNPGKETVKAAQHYAKVSG